MKTHKNHIKNQRARRKNPNIRQIKNGKPSKLWGEAKVEVVQETQGLIDNS